MPVSQQCGHYTRYYFSFSLSSPRRGCHRVPKFCTGSSPTQILGFCLGLISIVPVRSSGAGEAVKNYHGVAADLDLITLCQPMHGQGVRVKRRELYLGTAMDLWKYFTEPKGSLPEGARQERDRQQGV